MEVRSMSPAFTGRKLETKEVNKLLKNNWTIPVGVNDLGIRNKTSLTKGLSSFVKKFMNNIKAFFKM